MAGHNMGASEGAQEHANRDQQTAHSGLNVSMPGISLGGISGEETIFSSARSLLGDPRLRDRGNSPVRQATMLHLQRTVGNRAVQRLLRLNGGVGTSVPESAAHAPLQSRAGLREAGDTHSPTDSQDVSVAPAVSTISEVPLAMTGPDSTDASNDTHSGLEHSVAAAAESYPSVAADGQNGLAGLKSVQRGKHGDQESGESEEDEKEKDKEGKKEKKEKPKRPRTRKEHNLSEGESESEDPNIVWRSLRKEEKPRKHGLKPPKGHDPERTASQHITSGTRAKVKSGWVSFTRSRKVAGAWASESDKKVAKVRIPKEKREEMMKSGGRKVYDITDAEQAKEVFPSGKGSSLNTAKASQEVVVHGGLGPEDVVELFEAKKISVKEYKEIKERLANGEKVIVDGKEVYAAFRTRTETTKPPHPRLLLRLEKPSDEANEEKGATTKKRERETSNASTSTLEERDKKKRRTEDTKDEKGEESIEEDAKDVSVGGDREEFNIPDWDGRSLPDEVYKHFIRTSNRSFLVNGMTLRITGYNFTTGAVRWRVGYIGG